MIDHERRLSALGNAKRHRISERRRAMAQQLEAQGFTRHRIARVMGLSMQTVNTYLNRRQARKNPAPGKMCAR